MVPMRHETADDLGVMAAIYEPDVEMVTVRRLARSRSRASAIESGQSAGVAELATALLERRRVLELDWLQPSDAPGAARTALAPSFGGNPPELLVSELETAIDVLRELLGCTSVGVRLTTLSQAMCPRFHQDQVPCRLLITLAGPATEWIPAAQVDRSCLNDRSSTADPLLPGGAIEQLEPGNWSLLKGGAWHSDYSGVVHRSPALGPGASRLLASLDPVFAE